MAKKVYFCFYYQDVIDFRANVVRNHWVMKPDRESAGFFDASIWESAEKIGDVAIKRIINNGLNNTTVTCVLIGSQTYNRPWVRYEILKSLKRGNKIIGVHINSIKGKDQRTKTKGYNPFKYLGVTYSQSGETITLFEKVNVKWEKYKEIDGNASYRIHQKPSEYRGNGYNLASFYPVYDWIDNDGYNNFSRWVN